MAPNRQPEVRDRRPDLPYQVSITVAHVPTDRARRLREMGAKLVSARWSVRAVLALAAATLAAAMLAAAMLVAVVTVLLQSGPTHPSGGAAGATQRAAADAVAAAFGYPHRCLNIAISAAEPDYASAHVDRSGACADYHGYVNASFHRVHGVWRLVLDEGQLFVPNSRLKPAH